MTAFDETILVSAREDVAKFLTMIKAYKSAEAVKAGERDDAPLLVLFMAARLEEREKRSAPLSTTMTSQGALMAAEIDRLDREASKEGGAA